MKNFFTDLFEKRKTAFGLDIGARSIKILQLKKINNQYKLIGFARKTIPENTIINGEIKDEDKVLLSLREALKTARPNKITTPYLVFSLPEDKTFIRTISFPKIPKKEIDFGIRWEIEKYIPLSQEEIYLDWQIVDSRKDKYKIFIAAAPKKIINSYISLFKKANLKPIIIEPEATAEARALVKEKDKAHLIIDIGETKTLFIISDKDYIPFNTTIRTYSGSVFTKTISEELKIPPKKAENMKITCCSPKMTEQERKILKISHSILDDLANEITKIIDYYHSHFPKNNEITQILLCGGGANLTGISNYLSLKLRKKVRPGNPWININLVDPPQLSKGEALAFTKVIGLAIRGANLKREK